MNKVSPLGRIIEHHDIVKSLGYNAFGTFLQGSQNYGFEYEGSDVDSKSLVIPSFSDLCLSKPKTSFTHVHENNEHTDIKDARVLVQCWLKQNVNMVEILFTNFCMINPKYVDQYEILLHIRHELSRYDEMAGLKCCQGMALEKAKAMKHPYPSIIDKIEKYGYDPKQLHHIVRLEKFIKYFYMEGLDYEDAQSKVRENHYHELMDIKLGMVGLNTAEIYAKVSLETIDVYRRMFNNAPNVDLQDYVSTRLDEFVVSLFKEGIA